MQKVLLEDASGVCPPPCENRGSDTSSPPQGLDQGAATLGPSPGSLEGPRDGSFVIYSLIYSFIKCLLRSAQM